MNEQNKPDAISRPSEESSSSSSACSPTAGGSLSDISSTTNQNNHNSTTENIIKINQKNKSNNIVETEEMKRAAAKKLIERYFYQLIDGCGNPKCNNKYCASSGEVDQLTPNAAAARAIQLFSQEAKLCDTQPSKVAKTTANSSDVSGGLENELSSASASASKSNSEDISTATYSKSSSTTIESVDENDENTKKTLSSDDDGGGSSSTDDNKSKLSQHSSQKPSSKVDAKIDYLDEAKLNKLIEKCKEEKSDSLLIRTIGAIFSSRESIALSFRRMPSSSIDAMLEKAPDDLKNLKKEDLRTLEGDLDKDEDSSADNNEKEEIERHYTAVDLISLRRALKNLHDAFSASVFEPLHQALQSVCNSLTFEIRTLMEKEEIEDVVTIFVIIFEILRVGTSEFLEISLPSICAAATCLPVWAQSRLACIWSVHCKDGIRQILEQLQQLVTISSISHYYRDVKIQDNEVVCDTTKVMKIFFYANILAGELESPKHREEDYSDIAPPTYLSLIPEDDEPLIYNSKEKKEKRQKLEDPLAQELDINILDCRRPYLAYEEFYNEPLCDIIEMDHDYLNYKNTIAETLSSMHSSSSSSTGPRKFTFMLYSFILTPATKTLALYYDSRIRMYSERRLSFLQQQLGAGFQTANPFLKLKIRRDHIIDDALVELEMIAMTNPKDLKKQLVVEFVGEQGIDEGGVSKEFFQLIIEEIFNPDYGMFINNEDTHTVWFNSTSFENEAQFTLIGIVLGLAIYNNIILAVKFPMVVYRKLMGMKGSFADLEDWNPILHQSLKSMMDHQENDMEEVFMQTFKISYKDVFGSILDHDLKPDGDKIFVNQDNKQEFVDLYTDFLLNQNIEKQFKAFKRGFQMVTDESPLHLLFRPEEIELIVCGSKQFDFNGLETSTEYEGGFTAESQTIKDFWNIVHGLSMESKRKLLEFTTGSDRVPVGGLSRLKLVIARNGPDCDRLPTSHTCFNVLLLPEYSCKEKLEERLLKAINYSKGFGML